MNFNYTYIIASSEYSYNDLVENVKNNTYEIVAADLTITSSRTDKIDFSYPIYDNTMRLVVRKGKATEINPFAFLKPFHWKLWLLIVSIIYILPALLIALYELHEQKDNLRRQRISIKKNKCQYDTITTSLLRGFTFQSTTFYGHFQIIIVWLVGIILTALLTSNLIIYFKAQYEKPLLESIEDLQMCHKVSCDRIGIIEGSQHEEYFTNEVMKNESKLSYHRLKHPDECYAKLLDNHIDVAIADSSSADYFIQMPDYDRLQTTGPPFGKSYFGIAIPKQWPYKQDLDKNIMDLKLNGELDRLLSEWFQQKHYDREDNPYNNGLDGGMTIEETSGLFYIFGGLTGLNFIVFVSLYLYHWEKKAPAKAMLF
jgi:ionotropic glutamate receptor